MAERKSDYSFSSLEHYNDMPKEPSTTTIWPKWAIAAAVVGSIAVVGGIVALAVVLVQNNNSCDGFKCSSGPVSSGGSDCILSSSKCDGVQDCKDGEDEDDCIFDCPGNEFLCEYGGTNGKCIPNSYKCDGFEDCNKGTDELNCMEPPSCQRTESIQTISTNCEVDVGNCSVSFCSDDVNPKCCGPLYERTTTNCPEGDIEYSRVKKCECQICESPKVFVSGRAEGCDPKLQKCSFSIEINDTQVARAGTEGNFNFSVDFPSNYRITFSIVDDVKDIFFSQIKVININSAQQAYSITVKMVLKPPSISFSAKDNKTVELGETEDVAIEFPAGSMFLEDGTLYEGEVEARINFVDPSNRMNVENIPAQLLTESDDEEDEGRPGMLSSAGMLQTEVKTVDGKALSARGVQIELNTEGLTEDEVNGMSLWEVNSSTGFWEEVTKMNTSSGSLARRRKRSTPSVITRFDFASARRIYNLDYLVWRYCYMKVRVFKDAQFLETSEVHNVPLISLYARSSNGAWANYLRAYSWNQNGYCVSVPCDASSFDVVQVYADDPDYIAVEPHVPENIQTRLKFDNRLNYFTVQIPPSNAVDDTNGPIYFSWWSCHTATFIENHFRLSRSLPEDIEINTIKINEDNIFSPWISDPFSWWPNRNLFKSCYVKVNVVPDFVTSESLKGWTLEAISRGGNHSITVGKEYGKRITSGKNLTACVEYKCPDTLSDGEYDRTEVTITPKLDEIVFSLEPPENTFDAITESSYSELIEEYDSMLDQIGGKSLTLLVPTFPYPALGIYYSESIHPKLAKSEARYDCIQGIVSVVTFSATYADMSGSGSGSGLGSGAGR